MGKLNFEAFTELTGYTETELRGKSRKADLAIAREIYWYCLMLCGWSSVLIGKEFDRKHPTILSGIKTVKNLIETDNKFIHIYKPFIENHKTLINRSLS